MWIEKIQPEFVGAKCTLPVRLREEGLARGTDCDALLAILPPELAVSRDNLDETGASIWMRRSGRAEG